MSSNMYRLKKLRHLRASVRQYRRVEYILLPEYYPLRRPHDLIDDLEKTYAEYAS